MPIKSKIRTIANYPQAGVMFRDITTLLKDAEGLALTVSSLAARYRDAPVDLVVGVEARGFILGAALAFALGKGFVPVRKHGKLPAATFSAQYSLEYGSDSVEMHVDALVPRQRVLLVDDLIATGGTALATAELIERSGGVIHECCVIVDLPYLGGAERLRQRGLSLYALTSFDETDEHSAAGRPSGH